MSAGVSLAKLQRFQGGVIPLILAALVLVFMLPLLRPPTGNEVLIGHDLVNQQYPLYSLIFDSVRGGNGLPMWNPYLFAGQSITSNPQSTIYYPPAWIMAVVGVPRGVGWLVIVHLWLGGWGMAMFARQLGASRAGALAGGMIYAFSSVMSAHLYAGHVNYLMCAAWLPWIVTGYLWGVRSALTPLPDPLPVNEEGEHRKYPFYALIQSKIKEVAWSLPGAAALGMCILTGYPPLLYFGVLWLVVMAGYEVRTRRVLSLQALYRLVMTLVIGGVLGAAMLLPVADFTLNSTRVEGSLGFSNSFALPLVQLPTLLIPNLFGEPNQGYWGLPFYEELTGYIGILPLAALFLARRRAATILLTIFVVAGVWVSLGIEGGLFSVLYYLLPGYSLFRVPPRALYFFAVGGAGLVALLITDLQDKTFQLSRRGVILPVLAASCVAITVIVVSSQPAAINEAVDPARQVSQFGNMSVLAGVVIFGTFVALVLWRVIPARWALVVTLIMVWADVGRVSRPLVQVGVVDVPEVWKTVGQIAPASPDFRVMTVPNNLDWQAGVSYTRHLNASGYDPLVNQDYQLLLEASGYNPTSPIARLLGVRYVVSDRAYEFSGLSGLESLISKTEANGWTVYETADPLPRTFVAPAFQLLDDDAARELLSSGKVDPLQTVLLDEAVDCPVGAISGEARITSYMPNEVRIAARSATPGILVLTDSYDPNWMVTVDGAPAEVLRAYTALRGVCIPAGEHEVVFRYEPRAFYAGVAISAASWLAVIGIGGFVVVRRVNRRKAENGTG